MPKHYRMSESQFNALMDLVDGARVLSYALPPAYTRTPKGQLLDLAEPLSIYVITAKAVEDGVTS